MGQRQLLRRRSQRGAPIAHQHGTQQRASRQVVALHADLAVHHQQMPPADCGEFAPRHRQRLVGQGRQAGTRAVADILAPGRARPGAGQIAVQPVQRVVQILRRLHRRGPALRPQDGRGQQLPTPRRVDGRRFLGRGPQRRQVRLARGVARARSTMAKARSINASGAPAPGARAPSGRPTCNGSADGGGWPCPAPRPGARLRPAW